MQLIFKIKCMYIALRHWQNRTGQTVRGSTSSHWCTRSSFLEVEGTDRQRSCDVEVFVWAFRSVNPVRQTWAYEWKIELSNCTLAETPLICSLFSLSTMYTYMIVKQDWECSWTGRTWNRSACEALNVRLKIEQKQPDCSAHTHVAPWGQAFLYIFIMHLQSLTASINVSVHHGSQFLP